MEKSGNETQASTASSGRRRRGWSTSNNPTDIKNHHTEHPISSALMSRNAFWLLAIASLLTIPRSGHAWRVPSVPLVVRREHSKSSRLTSTARQAHPSERRTTSLQSSTATMPSLPSVEQNEDQPQQPAVDSKTLGDFHVSWDWQKVANVAFEAPPSTNDDSDNENAIKIDHTSPIILFDGVCNFCNAGVNLCLDLDDGQHFRFASIHSITGQSLLIANGKHPQDTSSIVLVTAPDEAYFCSDAVLRIAQELHGLPAWIRQASKVGRRVAPRWVRDTLYHWIAHNRHAFGTSAEGETCRLDLDGTLQLRFLQDPDFAIAQQTQAEGQEPTTNQR